MKRACTPWLGALALALALQACGDDPAAGGVDTQAGEVEVQAPDASIDASAETSDDTIPESIDAADDSAADGIDASDGGDDVETVEDVSNGSTERLDEDLEPCDHPQYWPFSIRSEKVPLRVHYRMPNDVAMVRQSLSILEQSWRREVDELGFAAPLLDEGTCGEDEALDIFTWRGAPYAYVDIRAEHDATPWDDGYPYMVVDPWGEFGDDELPATLAHEFNHMCQSAYDWSDATFLYEATATFIEDEVFDDHNSYWYLLFDFQGNPDWSLDRDDSYETWYMYGAALWLRFLRDRYYQGDAHFAAELWQGLRSSWEDNEPDYVDSVDGLLARFGASFLDSVIEFARWRWYVADRDDGMHLEEAGAFPLEARPKVAATVAAQGGSAIVRPMMLGTSYVDIVSTADGPRDVSVSMQTNVPAGVVHWVIQVVPGISAGSDGELLSLPADVALTDVGGRIMRTIAVTALPGIDRDTDPDGRTDERFTLTLEISPR